MEQLMSTNKTVKLAGIITAVDPIYSPRGYARTIFGDALNDVNYDATDNRLAFSVKYAIAEQDVSYWMNRLLSDGDNNVAWYVTDEDGKVTEM